jgi:hypothetical protein
MILISCWFYRYMVSFKAVSNCWYSAVILSSTFLLAAKVFFKASLLCPAYLGALTNCFEVLIISGRKRVFVQS